MTNGSEHHDDSFYTKHGLKLRGISIDEYNEDRPHALRLTQVEENTIYEARGTSKRLEKAGSAVSFNVMVSNLEPAHPNLARRGFLLLALDEDFQISSTHKAKIRTDGIVENDPITIQPRVKLRLGATLFHTYLVSNTDEGFDSLLSAFDAIDSNVDNDVLASV